MVSNRNMQGCKRMNITVLCIQNSKMKLNNSMQKKKKKKKKKKTFFNFN